MSIILMQNLMMETERKFVALFIKTIGYPFATKYYHNISKKNH